MDKKRTFIAVDVIPNQKVVSLMDRLMASHSLDKIKWVKPEIMHLTLFFLGDTRIDVLPDISQKLRKRLMNCSAFFLTLKGLGAFGRPMPKVIWVGVDFPEELKVLKDEIDDALLEFGFSDDKPNFNPHLTLGRVKFLHNYEKLKQEIKEYKGEVFQEIRVSSVGFYESVLRPEGPEYRELERFDLSNA
jgi:2'-5' RNA ligase